MLSISLPPVGPNPSSLCWQELILSSPPSFGLVSLYHEVTDWWEKQVLSAQPSSFPLNSSLNFIFKIQGVGPSFDITEFATGPPLSKAVIPLSLQPPSIDSDVLTIQHARKYQTLSSLRVCCFFCWHVQELFSRLYLHRMYQSSGHPSVHHWVAQSWCHDVIHQSACHYGGSVICRRHQNAVSTKDIRESNNESVLFHCTKQTHDAYEQGVPGKVS